MISITIKFIAITVAIIELERKHNQILRPVVVQKAYDYIIVGAGAAGAVVAARLAEDKTKLILLLEAGGPQNATSDVPAFQEKLHGDPFSDWNYPFVKQKHAFLGWKEEQVQLSRARVFGGSTVHNALNYYRDDPHYWDVWHDLYGIQNWTFSDVLPYFLKSENNLDKHLVRNDPQFHRSGGEYTISTANPPDIMVRRYVSAVVRRGQRWTHTDGRDPFGISLMQRSINEFGRRESTATAFLERDIKANLHTIGLAHVSQVMFDEHKRAVGVKFRKDNIFHTVYARNEVILSAGAIGTPQLLLLSGIGPKAHLNSMGIPVISDLSVGKNFKHSVGFDFYYDILNQTEIEIPTETLDNYYKFYVEHTGPLAYKLSGVHCFREVAYSANTRLSNGCVLPRIDFLLDPLESYVKYYKMEKQWKDYFRPYLGRAYFRMFVFIRRARSPGTLQLRSTNPFDKPYLDPCVFCDKQDLDDMVRTIQLSLNFYNLPELSHYIRKYRNPIPGCTPCADYYFCYQYIQCMAQVYTHEIYVVGTARMGSDSDPDGVVDNRFRVRGVSRLRVIDSSVIPVCNEQTTAWTVMIGERGSDFVKQDCNH